MALDYIVDSLDSLDESLHSVYDERDGKFYLNADKYADQKAAGLKTNAANLKKEKDKLKAEYEGFKKKFADIADEDLPTFLEWKERKALGEDGNTGDEKKSAEAIAAKYQQQLKAEREKWEAAKAKELADLDADRKGWQSKFRNERLSNRLKEYAIKAGVFADELETFVDLMVFKGHFDLSEDDDVIFMQDGSPSAITAEKAINETLRERYKRFYEAPTQGGSGSQAGRSGSRSSVDWQKLSPEERMAFGRKQPTARS